MAEYKSAQERRAPEIEAPAPPECPYCGETEGLRTLYYGNGVAPPEYICRQCLTAMDDGPGFDDLEPVT